MHTPPDSRAGAVTRELLRRAARRHASIPAAYVVAFSLLFVLLPVVLTGWPLRAILGAGAVAAGIVVIIAITIARRSRVAFLIEARAPECRNLIITAAELMQDPQRGGSVRELVLQQADRIATSLDPATLFPLRQALGAVGAAAVVVVMVIAVGDDASLPGQAARKANAAARIHGIDVIVEPPAYTALTSDTLHNPARIIARAGSRLRILVGADADSVAIETVDGHASLEHCTAATRECGMSGVPNGVFHSDVIARADGYIAVHAAGGRNAGVRQLIGLSVTPDAPPRIRVTAPGRDLYVANAPARLDIALEADDDVGLGTLRLHYTRVSGSGEQFEFRDGEVPLRVERTNTRSWKARGVLALDTLKLTAGDMIVYRGVVADRRPGSEPIESDAFILEVTGPGALAAGGFATDDEHDRYAISQQMLIVETERLESRRAAITADALKQEAMRLASLQRQVRAEFVFMMGGELADEVGEAAGIMELDEHEEAEAEDDILAGRLANRGRVELVRAIRAMSSASSALTDADLATALGHERTALAYLQRAFSRTRYILRTLSERERLDLSRRLTGTLADAARDVRPGTQPEPDARTAALRRVLAGIAELAGTAELAGQQIPGSDAALQASSLAQDVLRIDAGAESLQQVAAQLTSAAASMANGQRDAAHSALEAAALQTAAVIRAALPPASAASASLETRVLEGALVDALRRQVPR